MEQRSSSSRLDFLDGFRLLAAALVLLHHLSAFFQTPALIDLLTMNGSRVAALVALSGFCLYLPSAKREQVELPHPFLEFLRRRAFRLLPGWYASLLLCMGVGLLFRALHYHAPYPLLPQNGMDLWTHLTLTHSLTRYSGSINGPGYTLGIEWQLSLLFPVFLWIASRYGWGVLTSIILFFSLAPLPGIVGVIAPHIINPTFAVPFLLGMIAARLLRQPIGGIRLRPESVTRSWLYASLIGFAAFSTVDRYSHRGGCWLVGLSSAILFLYLAINGESRLRRLFSHRTICIRFAPYAYSLYLVHFPLLAVGSYFAATMGWKGYTAFYLACPPTLLLIGGMTWLMHRWETRFTWERRKTPRVQHDAPKDTKDTSIPPTEAPLSPELTPLPATITSSL